MSCGGDGAADGDTGVAREGAAPRKGCGGALWHVAERALFGTSLSGRSADTIEERAEAYGWDDFIDGVCGEKLAFLRENLSWNEAQDKTRVPFGKSKAYQLLTLLEDGGDDIQIARFAYVLARFAAGLHTEQKAAYERVRSQLYAWYRDKEERRQLRTALEFIIYSLREKGENADG